MIKKLEFLTKKIYKLYKLIVTIVSYLWPRHSYLLVFVFLLSTQFAYAQRWELVPGSPTTISTIACDANGNLWVSKWVTVGYVCDVFLYNGTSWEQKGSILRMEDYYNYITAIAVAPNGDIYVAWGSLLYRSTNGGTSWNNVFDVGYNVPIEKIVFNNTSGAVYFVANWQGIYRPNGNSWTNANNGLPSSNSVEALAIAPNGTLYAGLRLPEGGNVGVYRSTDGGVNWLPSTNYTNAWITHLAVVNNNTIFATTPYDGVLKSTNAGQSWTQCHSTERTNSGASCIIYNSITGELIVTYYDKSSGFTNNVFRSTDLGESWTVVNEGLVMGQVLAGDQLAFNPITGETYIGMVQYGVYRFVPTEPEPIIEIDPTTLDVINPMTIDFGDVVVGSSAQRNVTIKNIGDAPLVISNFSISGGGGMFTLPNGETTRTVTIEPGGNHSLTVQFLPTATITYNRTVTLRHNATGGSSTVQLTGRGVEPGITITPNPLNFGDVLINTSRIQNITIQNNGGAPLNISQISISGGVFTFPNNETSRTIQPGGSSTIAVQFLPTAVQSYNGTVTLEHNASGGSSTVQLTGRGVEPEPIIEIDPTTLDITNPMTINFGDVEVGDSSQRSVTIKNIGTAPLDISNFSISEVVFTFPSNETQITILPGGSYSLTVQFLPTAATTYNGSTILTHNNKNVAGSTTTILFTGRGIGADITITPNPLNFGDVLIDSSRTENITIQNSGNVDLLISQVSINGTGFTLPNNENTTVSPQIPITIAAGVSSTIAIQFLPSVVGSHTGTVTLTHNASATPSTVSLIGRGVQPGIAIDSTSIDFGDVLVFTPSIKTFKITNDGNADLIISSMNPTGTDANQFTFTPSSPIIIAPTQNRDITVEFLPTSVGVKSAQLNIDHNGSPSITVVPLIGRGITATADVTPDTINFGSVQLGSQNDSAVYVINTGTIDMYIIAMSSGGNGDFIVNLILGKLEPGQSQRVAVTFKPTSLGYRKATLDIITSVGEFRVQFTGYGDGTPVIAIDPTSINFDDVLVSNSSNKTFTITNNGNADLLISSMNITGADAVLFTFTPSSPITIAPSGNRDITVQFLPTSIGIKNAQLNINHNAISSPSNIPLTGTGVQANIALNPSDSINFSGVPVNSPSSNRYITITNIGTAPLTITNLQITGADASMFKRVSSPDSILFQSITIGAGSSFTFTFNFTPTSADVKNARVTFTHSLGSSEVAFTGVGLVPAISITPNSLDFGNVRIGTSLSRTVTITNSGAAPLVISSFTISPNIFTLSNGESSITLQPGDSHTLTVQFLPTVATSYIGTITLTHNASGSPSVISLQGSGIVSDVKVAILKNYIVKPNDVVKVSVQAMEDLSEKNVKSFSFVLRYNKRILSVRDVSLTGTISSMLSVSIGGSTPGELIVTITNPRGEPLTGIGSLIDINFIGLRGDTCGTQLILESFIFNPDGPNAITENGYCELFGRCGEEPPYVTTDQSTRVYQNNPNPIQEGYESTIQYRINTAGETSIIVYDILGREVAKLVNEYKSEGIYSVTFNTKGLPSGVYFYKLRAPGYEGLKKMVVIR